MTVVNLLTFDLVLAVIGQKVAIPMGGSQLAVVAFTNFAVMGVLFYLDRLSISPWRLLLFLLTFGSAILLQFVGPRINLGSFLLTFTTALPFVAVARVNQATYIGFLARFQIVAGCGVGLVFLDHAMQLAGLGMPNIEPLIPVPMRYLNYVYIQPLYWNSRFDKPNGLFFLEASTISQFIALALVFELGLFRRVRMLTLYGAGIMAVFAGTGFALLLATSPILLSRYLKARLLLFGAAIIPIALAIAFATGWADIMTARTAEFDKAGSSGHARFVAPFLAIGDQFVRAPLPELLTGQGAGMQEKSTDIMLIPATKMLLDYGLITAAIYLIFTLTCTFGSGAPFLCAWVTAFYFQIFNGGASQPITAVYCYLLVAAYDIVGPRQAQPRTGQPARAHDEAYASVGSAAVFEALPGRMVHGS